MKLFFLVVLLIIIGFFSFFLFLASQFQEISIDEALFEHNGHCKINQPMCLSSEDYQFQSYIQNVDPYKIEQEVTEWLAKINDNQLSTSIKFDNSDKKYKLNSITNIEIK